MDRYRKAAVSLWVIVLAAIASVSASAADASFPGRNGVLAISLEGCEENTYIRAYTPDGRKLGPLTPRCEPKPVDGGPFSASTWAPEWSADGQRLLYFGVRGGPAGFATIAPDGSDVRPLRLIMDPNTRQPIDFDDKRASFSPDGRHIAYDYGRAIWIAAVDGTEMRRLRASPRCSANTPNCVGITSPRWSPDGRVIAFEAHQYRWGGGKPSPLAEGIWLMSASTGKLIRRVAKSGHEIDWSPDGRHLAYRTPYQRQEERGGASGGNIYIVGVDGKGKRRLVHRHRIAETFPTWSPDGRWIAWVALSFGAGDTGFDVRASVWRVRSQGGRARQIVQLPSPTVDEIWFHAPQLSWQAQPGE